MLFSQNLVDSHPSEYLAATVHKPFHDSDSTTHLSECKETMNGHLIYSVPWTTSSCLCFRRDLEKTVHPVFASAS